jgi:hypothetical protein
MTATISDVLVSTTSPEFGSWSFDGPDAVSAVNDEDDNTQIYTPQAAHEQHFTLSSLGFPANLTSGGWLISVTIKLRGGAIILGTPNDITPLAEFTLTNGALTFEDALSDQAKTITLNVAYGVWVKKVGVRSGTGGRVPRIRTDVLYSPAPNAPTLVSPSGNVGSLTPTMQTSVNNPAGGDTVTHTDIEVRRVSDNALFWASGWQSGTSIGYAGSTLANGVEYKWRARHKNTYGAIATYSGFTNFTPVLSDPPVATLVSPIGGTSVGSLTPTLTLNFSDPNAGDVFSAYQLQVRRVSDQVLFWDPGQVATSQAQKDAKQASVVYGGTTLVAGTTYEWRARVQDDNSVWSNYTGWESFTPQTAPDAPTLTSPSGLVNTLTPTIQGTYNQGSGGSEAAFQYEVRQGTTTIYQSGDVATVIATGQAYGTDNPSDTPSTPPALAWGTSYSIRARSKDAAAAYSAWTSWQNFNTNAKPTTPGIVSPSGDVTGDTTPTLTWTYSDPDGDAQTVAEVELRKVSDDSVVTGYGPKELTQSTQTHDVTETLIDSPATEYKWRVRVKGLAGPGFSDWSSWATFTVATAPTVTVSSPTQDQVLGAPAHAIQWSLSGGSGTQQDYRVKVLAADQATVVHDTGVVAGTATSYALASGILKNGNTYYVQVIARDTLNQEAQSSLVRATTSWTPPATITGISVVAVGSQT